MRQNSVAYRLAKGEWSTPVPIQGTVLNAC
jgi:hypothetical protein